MRKKSRLSANALDEFINSSLSISQIEELIARIGSPHRVTKIRKRPEVANNHECIVIAELLGCTVATLIDEYELGLEGLSYEEQKYHRHLRNLEPALNS